MHVWQILAGLRTFIRSLRATLNGATTVLFESVPNYPDAGRYWEMVERLKINQFYTAPQLCARFSEWVMSLSGNMTDQPSCAGNCW